MSATVYVGNLDQRVTENHLVECFSPMGAVTSTKIIAMHRNGPFPSVNYGFVEFSDPAFADKAIKELNGFKLFDYEIKVNWAQQGTQQTVKEEAPQQYQIFVGDLAPEITDELLAEAFKVYGEIVNAHVMRDTMSGNSRGFGFVTYRQRGEADQAIASMNGEMLGSRNIRVNWGQKNQPDAPPPRPGQTLPYDTVLQQTPAYVTSVYVGNLPPNVSDNDLLEPFQQFGFIQEIKLQTDKGFAFVKLDTHQNAANAIVQLQGMNINGREAKLSWGKDRPPQNFYNNNGFNNNNNGGNQRQVGNNWRQRA